MEQVTERKGRKTKDLRLSRIEKVLVKLQRSRLFERVETIEKRLSSTVAPDAIGERLSMVESMVINAKGILTSKEACQYLGFTNSYLYKLTSENKIPYYRPTNGHILFVRQELDNWVINHKVDEKDER